MKIKFNDITKRILAILCAFVMMFSTVVTAATPENDTSQLSRKELNAIELLNVIGIYDGVDSIVGREDFVRRDVMAFLAARIMGIDDQVYQGESLFSDVDKDNFAYNAINILAQMNIIKTAGNKFEPTRDITLTEATEIILRLMGYSNVIDTQGSRMITKLAQEHELHKGITHAKDKRLQVKNLSALLYNTLTSGFPQLVYMSSNGNFEYRIEKDETLLSKTFDVYAVEGIITANDYTSVDVVSESGQGSVKIGNEVYQVGKTDADKYVGYYVTAYYHKGDENTLLCIDVESTNTVVVLDAEDVEYENFEYTTYLNKREKEYPVSKGLNLIYNGKAIYYDKNKMVPEYGTITLVNNDKDEEYDTVIIRAVRNFVVGSYGTTTNIIQSKYDNLPIDLNKYDEDMYSIHKADGKAYKPASLKEWDVLSILESDDGEYLDITVSDESVVGSVEKISNFEGKPVVTIDGVEYDVAKLFYNNKNYNLAVGYSGTFYLDIFGRIAAANGKVTQVKWGYVIKARKNEQDGFTFKILTQDSSTVKVLESSETWFVNDVKYTEENIGTLTFADYQVVRYRLDKDGKIKSIYTVGNEFIQLAGNSSRGFVSNVFVANQVMDIAVDSNTVFLQVPNRAAGDNQNDSSFYSLMTLGNFVRDSWYTVSAYGFEQDNIVAPFVLVERSTSNAATPSGTYMVVTDIQVSVNKDNIVVDQIIGYDNNKNKVEILTKSSGVASSNGIEEGDFFAMVLYPDGTLQRPVQIYDYKTGAFNSNYKARDYNQTHFGRLAYAYDMSGNFLLLSDDSAELTTRKVINASSATVFIVDSTARRDMIRVGSLADIKTLKQSGTAAKVVFYGSNSVPRVIVCYQ